MNIHLGILVTVPYYNKRNEMVRELDSIIPHFERPATMIVSMGAEIGGVEGHVIDSFLTQACTYSADI